MEATALALKGELQTIEAAAPAAAQ